MTVNDLEFQGPTPLVTQADRNVTEKRTSMAGAPALQPFAGSDPACAYKAAYIALVDPGNGDVAYLYFDSGSGEIRALREGPNQPQVVVATV